MADFSRLRRQVGYRLEGGTVDQHEFIKKRPRLLGRKIDGQQSLPERLDQVRDQLEESSAVPRRLLDVQAPEDTVQRQAECQRAAAGSFSQHGQPLLGQDLRPGTGEKSRDDAVVVDEIGASPDFGGDLDGHQVTLFRLKQGLDREALHFSIFRGVAALPVFEIVKQSVKVLGIADAFVCEQDSDFAQVLQKFRKASSVFARISQACAGNGFQQLSCRMAFVAEKPGIRHHQAQKCRFRIRNHLPNRRQESLIAGHLLDHQSNHLNGQ